MLEEILLSIHNRFEVEGAALSGTFTVSSGTLDLPTVMPGQYFWIEGSVFNDGLHQAPVGDLKDETFTGTIYPAAIPVAVERIASEIQTWVKEHPETDMKSESFGGYSYNRATDGNGRIITWEAKFAPRLNKWRCIS